jgi:hypothetical protein
MNKTASTLAKLQNLADNAGTEGERKAALRAIKRVQANNPSREVVRGKVLMEHQRRAWLCLVAGAGKLSRSESAFLHNVREKRFITDRMERWLSDIDTRLRWEAENVPAK